MDIEEINDTKEYLFELAAHATTTYSCSPLEQVEKDIKDVSMDLLHLNDLISLYFHVSENNSSRDEINNKVEQETKYQAYPDAQLNEEIAIALSYPHSTPAEHLLSVKHAICFYNIAFNAIKSNEIEKSLKYIAKAHSRLTLAFSQIVLSKLSDEEIEKRKKKTKKTPGRKLSEETMKVLAELIASKAGDGGWKNPNQMAECLAPILNNLECCKNDGLNSKNTVNRINEWLRKHESLRKTFIENASSEYLKKEYKKEEKLKKKQEDIKNAKEARHGKNLLDDLLDMY